jgi:hypothetical protein
VATVVISPYNVVDFPEGGGHFWVYMQYAQGLRQAGCDVYWLERVQGTAGGNGRGVASFLKRLERYGLKDKGILYSSRDEGPDAGVPEEYVGLSRSQAEAVFRRADLLLNFHYAIAPALLSRFRRTAMVDIDPGLLQVWMSTGQLRVPPHDVYFTTGETVGTRAANFPDCGLVWNHVRPPVCLELWPYVHDGAREAFTTVAGWWSGKWVRTIEDGAEILYENTKRVAFLEFVELPRRTSQVLELALCLADTDGEDRRSLERHGWRVRSSWSVVRTPEMYRSYIQHSRGEFSCAKPSCMRLQNGWVSDRTLCYLASGKPAVVQNTGPSSVLPNGEGVFRFSTIAEAVEGLAAANADYGKHCRAAREIAETYFDARETAARILNVALGEPASLSGACR